MNSEIEAQFLNINKNKIREKLKEIGAECVKPEVLMRRVVFALGEHEYARVRDEGGGKIVMTYKHILDDKSILGKKEVNVTIDDYENGVLFLKSCGLRAKKTEDSYRETWMFDDVEICIDTWPWLPTYIEIEGPSEDKVWDTAKKLGLKKEEARFGSVDTIYQYYYGIDTKVFNNETKEVSFEMEPPEWARKRIK